MQDSKNISWLQLKTSLFCCCADNTGKQRTFHQILFSDFGDPHPWYFKDNTTDEWVSDVSNDLHTIVDIRTGKATKDEIPLLKQTLQCFTPSGYYSCKKKGSEKLIAKLPILQMDFDHVEDIANTKRKIFALPCTAYVGESVSGKGLFALILIDNPEQLRQYAEHCFAVFSYYGLKPDTSKGRNYSDLRFVSYDANALYRPYPIPLKIERFYTQPKKEVAQKFTPISDDRLIRWAVKQVQAAQPGNRFPTIQKVAYYLGGYGTGLDEIKQAIVNSPQYEGVQNKYLLCASDCFSAGGQKPISWNK